jgi:hypothetical protein
MGRSDFEARRWIFMKKERPPVRPSGLQRICSTRTTPRGWTVTILSGWELQAEGCGGVVKCDTETVAFYVGGAVFCVYGQALSIDAMEGGGLMIRGRIERTELIP